MVGGELPERERTKHVHRLHPVPRQVRPAARRGAARTGTSSRAGSSRPVRRLGHDARRGERVGSPAAGCDISAFNCLLARVKTAAVRARPAARRSCAMPAPVRARRSRSRRGPSDVPARVVRAAGARRAPRLPRPDRRLPPTPTSGASSSRGRPARRAGRPTSTSTSRRAGRRGEYCCHKHRRTCRPVGEAAQVPASLHARHGRARLGFADARRSAEATVLHGDARALDPPGPVDARRHLAALPGPDRLPRAAPLRLRAARPRAARLGGDRPRRRRLLRRRRRDPWSRARRALAPGGRVLVVVNDRRGLYRAILDRCRPPARGAERPPREPADRPAEGRVLRGRARRRAGAPPGQASGLTASARFPSSSILPSAASSLPAHRR